MRNVRKFMVGTIAASGGKARGQLPRDTAEDALLQLHALHHSHREVTRHFLM